MVNPRGASPKGKRATYSSGGSTAAKTLPELFFHQVKVRGDELALRNKDFGFWQRISWNQYGVQVRTVAAGLTKFGVRPGERVAIMGDNRPEWFYCHLGIMTAGASTCGIYATSSPEEILYILSHSEARFLFLETDEHLDKTLSVLSKTQIEKIIVWDAKGLWGFKDERVMFFGDFMDEAKKHLASDPTIPEKSLNRISPEDTAMVIYTSGTTGPPKGAMISHNNIVVSVDMLTEVMEGRKDDEVISYLPLAHIYENMVSVFMAIKVGYVVNFVESFDTLFTNLREVSPTYFASVPRIWEKMASTVELRMQDSTYLKRGFYKLAMKIGKHHARLLRDNEQIGIVDQFLYKMAYWTVLQPLRRRLGFERTRLAVCAAAPASTELFEYYQALGIPLIEAYGQTESTGLITSTLPGRIKLGTVGEPISGIEVKLGPDGEILTRGPHVFKGYYKDPELTANTIDKDGWLHTGDVGAWDGSHLIIRDRIKDIIITSGGKNITPAFIENKLKFSHYIQDAVVIGEKRKYLVALILIDEDNVTKFCQDNRVPFTTFAELAENKPVNKLISVEIEKVNKTLSQVETIKKFALLPKRFYQEEGDVTPTQKVKRSALSERYADLIESLYGK